ncbi:MULTISPECIES: hypothetical protein [unclassified Roseateles]|uniref:hypothetical protein n=1 Tax=unclassified Roseateles TaxID=2626991 RepID=UPI0007023C34|nr:MULTISPECIES: hypothetical protein [unclassified Roseateles]KQW45582.1 hypothetical protein ASC81_11825 [Pelomonas sp. Root405]KRA72426.1 hypothetical protein ASD88_11825 [Pelomonas sp. Root662]
MRFWLLLLVAAVFVGLALDAWRMRGPSRNVPYEIEAAVRGESLGGLPLWEQRERQKSFRRKVGSLNTVFLVWATLAAGCLLAALLSVVAEV